MKIAPVVIIVFNRPETTARVFERIREVKPEKLYIIADAPRQNNDNDVKNCAKVLEIVSNVDWECEVKQNIASNNLGVGPRPFSGIDWVFNIEDRAIILEDDCVPATSFFSYCTELLEKYIDDPRIMHIAGSQYFEDFTTNDDSYFFSKYSNISGWATWRRAWKLYDFKLLNYAKVKQNCYFDYGFSKREAFFWKGKFDSARDENYRIWDYQWQYTVFTNAGLCVFPKRNLISNIDPFGATPNARWWIFFKKTDNEFRITQHPKSFIINKVYDDYIFDNHFYRKRSISQKIVGKLIKIIKLNKNLNRFIEDFTEKRFQKKIEKLKQNNN